MREFNFALILVVLALYTLGGIIVNSTAETALIQDTTGFVLFLAPYLLTTLVSLIWYGRAK